MIIIIFKVQIISEYIRHIIIIALVGQAIIIDLPASNAIPALLLI